MEKTALVLSGGGSRGAYEVGVWRALRELGERFSIVTGTSVGAINAAVVTQGSEELAEHLWRELETSRVFDVDLDETLPARQKLLSAVKLFGKAAMAQGGAGTEALSALLRTYINEESIRASSIDMGVVTVQLDTMKPCYIWKDQMPQGLLVDYLIASSSLFPAIKPHEIGGVKYIDGGYADNLPIRMAIDRGASRVIAVDMDAIGVVRRDKAFAQYEIRTISSYWNLGAILLFDPNSARLNMRLGYLDTMRSFEVFDGFAYAFVRGTLSHVTNHFYSTFYETVDRLGFHNVRKKFLDSVAFAKISARIFRRGVRAPSMRGFALDGMESAAELLDLEVQTIFTEQRFLDRLHQQIDATPLPASLAALDFPAAQDKLHLVLAALPSASRAARTVFLARIIRASIVAARPCNLLPVATLMTDEFSAALFLALALL